MIIVAVLSERWSSAVFYKKKQREEDKRMKKKVLAFLLASTMVIEPFTVASAADFSDGMGQDTVQFSDDAEDVPEVENDDVDQFDTDVAGEGESSSKPSEDAIQMGDDVWFTFDDSTSTATISGTGDMWDYYEDGWDAKKEHKNPLIDKNRVIKHIIISDNITSVSDYLLYNSSNYDIQSLSLGNDIKKIGAYAFAYCNNLSSVILPDKLAEIGKNSFENAGIKNLTIPQNMEIWGKGSFSGCLNLVSVSLPDTLTKIPENCFTGCKNLNSIIIPDNVSYIGDSAFAGCQSLEEINIPTYLKNEPYMLFNGCARLRKVNFAKNYNGSISQRMFSNCSDLESIAVPDGTKQIMSRAFHGCTKLKEIYIPQSVDYIDRNAFDECDNLKIIKGYTGSFAETFAKKNGFTFDSIENVKETLQLRNAFCEWQGKEHSKVNVRCTPNKDVCYYVTYVKKGSSAPVYDANKKDGMVKANNPIYVNITDLPEEEVDIYVFVTDDDGNYTNAKITPNYNTRPEKPIATTFPVKVGENIMASLDGDVLTLTGSDATYDYGAGWDEMEDIYVANQWLDKEALSKIKKIVIGDGITQIGNYVFAGCTNLQDIVFPQKTLKRIKDYSFSGCSSLKEFIVPEGIDSLGEGFLYDCLSIEKISFPSTLKEIPCFTSDGGELPKLRSVVLAEGIEKIANGAFCHYKNLKTIILPSTLKEIGEYAFDYSGFVEITIPSNLRKVTRRAFEGDTNLKYVNLEDGVTIIEEDAFRDCTQLQYISIPESVTDIDALAFEGCPNFYIKGKKGSYAEKYANEYMIPFRTGSYKIIFKNNGRTVSTEYADKNESVTPPSLEEKPGYTLSWDADYTNIQEDMVINAVWTKKDNGGGNTTIIVSPSETNKYTVTFKDRGKIVKTEKVKSGDAAEYPYIGRNGYELSWDKDFSKVTANITVNAVWTVIKPEKVTSLTAESGKKSIALSWDETEYADYYLVYRKADSEKEYTQVAKTTKILWTDSKAVPGTQYSYKVVAVRSLSGKKYQGAESDVVTTKIGTPQIGDTYSVGDLNYKLTGTKEVTVTGLAKVTDTLVIPSSVTIGGKVYKVTAIQDKAFYRNEDIVNVTIGNNVVNVGKYAFYQCSGLETVKFGKRVAIINTCAFTQCPNLENVTLPSSIRKIGAKAFYQCTSIKIFKINGSALEYVGKKGLAINKTVTLRLPKKVYTRYKKLIKSSGVYSKTKFVKF